MFQSFEWNRPPRARPGSEGFCIVLPQVAGVFVYGCKQVELLASAMTEQLAALFDSDPRARARVMGIKRAG